MKKTMMILVSVLMISFMACSKTDEVKQNWVFTVTTVVSISPAVDGYPMTSTISLEQDNLSSTEADQILKGMNTTMSITNGGSTMTTTSTATKAVKK